MCQCILRIKYKFSLPKNTLLSYKKQSGSNPIVFNDNIKDYFTNGLFCHLMLVVAIVNVFEFTFFSLRTIDINSRTNILNIISVLPYKSKLFSFKRKSYTLITRIPSSVYHGAGVSLTTIIFLKESSM